MNIEHDTEHCCNYLRFGLYSDCAKEVIDNFLKAACKFYVIGNRSHLVFLRNIKIVFNTNREIIAKNTRACYCSTNFNNIIPLAIRLKLSAVTDEIMAQHYANMLIKNIVCNTINKYSDFYHELKRANKLHLTEHQPKSLFTGKAHENELIPRLAEIGINVRYKDAYMLYCFLMNDGTLEKRFSQEDIDEFIGAPRDPISIEVRNNFIKEYNKLYEICSKHYYDEISKFDKAKIVARQQFIEDLKKEICELHLKLRKEFGIEDNEEFINVINYATDNSPYAR